MILFWFFSCSGSKETGCGKTIKSHRATGYRDGTKEQDLHSAGGQWQRGRGIQRRRGAEEEPRKGQRKEEEAPQAKKRRKSTVEWGWWEEEVGCLMRMTKIYVSIKLICTMKYQRSKSHWRIPTPELKTCLFVFPCVSAHTQLLPDPHCSHTHSCVLCKLKSGIH